MKPKMPQIPHITLRSDQRRSDGILLSDRHRLSPPGAPAPAAKRRIAFVDYFCPHYRRPLFEELARRAEVDFYFFSDRRDRWWNSRIPIESGGEFRRVELPRVRIGPESFLPTLPLRITGARYDAVIKNLNGRVMLSTVYAACKLRDVPLVLWTGMWQHPTTPFHRLSKPLVEALYRDVGAIVAYGEHVKEFLTAIRGVDPAKIFVAGQAVDANRFAAAPAPGAGAPVALFIGQFEERKGIRDLLDAFSRLDDLDAELRLVGNGSLEDEITIRADRMTGVSVVGYLPQDRIPPELARARCLVLPSITTAGGKEPWGLVVNEAMHAGVPVVATDSLGAAAGGLVRDGRNGYVVPERDPARLADSLRRLLTDVELASQLGRQAHADVAEFNYERMASAFEASVEHALATHGRR